MKRLVLLVAALLLLAGSALSCAPSSNAIEIIRLQGEVEALKRSLALAQDELAIQREMLSQAQQQSELLSWKVEGMLESDKCECEAKTPVCTTLSKLASCCPLTACISICPTWPCSPWPYSPWPCPPKPWPPKPCPPKPCPPDPDPPQPRPPSPLPPSPLPPSVLTPSTLPKTPYSPDRYSTPPYTTDQLPQLRESPQETIRIPVVTVRNNAQPADSKALKLAAKNANELNTIRVNANDRNLAQIGGIPWDEFKKSGVER